MALRMIFGEDRFWLSFVPPLAGMIWGAWYYLLNRSQWNWCDRLPVVVFVSLLTSPYGWVYDQVLLLIPLTQVLALAADRRPKVFFPIVLAVTTLTVCCFGLHSAGLREFTFLWHAPLAFVLYLIARRVVLQPADVTPRTAP
jgi:hypothetical protein